MATTDRLGWLFPQAVERWPDVEFVYFEGERYSFAEVGAWVDTICEDLVASGVRPHDRVLIHVPNCVEALAVKLAGFRIGAVVSPVIPIYRAHELEHILGDLRPAVVVVSATLGPRRPAEEIDDILQATGITPRLKYVVGGEVPGWRPVPRPAPERGALSLPDGYEPLGPDECCLILYTSGTYALPKGAMLSSSAVLAQADAWRTNLAIGPGGVIMCVAPLAHLGGFISGYLLPASVGARTILMPGWNADVAVDLIEKEEVDFSVGAVTFLLDIVTRYESGVSPGHHIRAFLCGGTSCPPDLIRRAQDQGIMAFRAYGMTEAGTCTFADPNDPLERRANYDGRVNKGTEIQAVDESRNQLPWGERGELRIRGLQRMMGYTDPARTAELIDEDGWFYSGDVGILDEDGWLQVKGRVKDIINRGGEKFSALDIEAAICAHPTIANAAVLGVPDERFGEAVAAFVTLRPGSEWQGPQDVLHHLNEMQLAKQKLPVEWHVLEALPLTGSGKVQKPKLLEMWEAGR